MFLEIRICWAAGVLFAGYCSLLEAASRECFVDIPVYDARGYKLPFVISKVFKSGERQVGDLLQLTEAKALLEAAGSRLYFDRSAIRALLDIELKGPYRATVATEVALNTCRQRSSARFGQLDSGADVSFSALQGQISGCPIDGDWWIRAVPMFGEYAQGGAYDGVIRPDGSFALAASMRGVRHIVIIGKDREPLKTFAMDVVVGGKNTVGKVDMRGSCPQ